MHLEIIDTPSRNAVAWRGITNILLGILILVWPQITAYVVVLLFSINLIIVGLFAILEPLFDKNNQHSIMTVGLGILGVTFGVYLIIKPEFAVGLIGILVAFWALLFGIFDLIIASKEIKNKMQFAWVYAIIGFISVIFGLYMLFSPLQGILTIVWIIGLYAVIVGATLVLSSILMKPVTEAKIVKKRK